MFIPQKKVEDDIELYKESLRNFLEGKISAERFKGIRVPWGFYSHRGGKIFMARIRIPNGILYPSQLKGLAVASQKYGDGVLHITTRQDIQIHNIKIDDTPALLDFLKEFHLSSRGGGGNTIRNITGCPLAGVCKDEVFDIRNYSVSLSEYLLGYEDSFTLPRKFKMTFAGCKKDCVGALLNDIGFIASKVDGKKGFKVFVGGGMGASSRKGKLLRAFIDEKDIGYCVSSIKNIFFRMGDRRNKHHNRLRFLIEDIGFEKFKSIYEEEFRSLKETQHVVLREIEFPAKNNEKHGDITQKDETKVYQVFLKHNVCSQKQKGFSLVKLRIPRGDLKADKAIFLSKLEKEFPGIEFRTTLLQNISIIWIEDGSVYKLYRKLREILNDFFYPETLLDLVCCKGASTCNLGLCNSPALSEHLEKFLKKEFTGSKIFSNLDIKINGCPNACGHHPAGTLAFHGIVRKVDNRPVPFYKFLLGGKKDAENTLLSEEVGIIPAKKVPDFLNDFLKICEGKIPDNGDVQKFILSEGKTIATEVIARYNYVPPYQENSEFYRDWGKKEDFSLSGIGPGECGSGVLDMIEEDITEAKTCLESAEKKEFAYQEIKKGLFLSARALLIVRGAEPKKEMDAFDNFTEIFIKKGIASVKYIRIKDVFNTLTEKTDSDTRKKTFVYAENFLKHINRLYKKMDSSFNFPAIEKEEESSETKAENVGLLDLKGTPCPINYVKVKLALEELSPGDILEVILDEGKPIDNVPKSLESDGHKILNIEKSNNWYKVTVKKTGEVK